MKKLILIALFQTFLASSQAQLTIDNIMADPKISVGALPSGVYWSEDSKTIYFRWNPELKTADSLYAVTLTDKKPVKVTPEQRRTMPAPNGNYNRSHTQMVYAKNGDLFLLDRTTMAIRTLTNTVENEGNPYFLANDEQVVFTRNNNVFSVHLATGMLTQWSNFQSGSAKPEPKRSEQEKWLRQDQLALFDVLQERADKKKEGERNAKAEKPKRPKEIFYEEKRLEAPQLSPDGNYITYRLSQSPKNEKRTIVPSYVTESGFTEDIPARSKVGDTQTTQELWVYDIQKDTAIQVSVKNLEGIYDLPDFVKDYQASSSRPDTTAAKAKKAEPRKVYFDNPIWSDDGRYCVLILTSQDNKDRWIVQLDPAAVTLKVLDRQRDEAWIGGPIDAMGFLGDNRTLYYQSEASGYAHLYTIDLATGKKIQLTQGKFEVQRVRLSQDKRFFYLTTNEVHPGEKQLYKMSVRGGERVRLTQQSGAYQVELSPDETQLAYLYSSATQPWELFVQANDPAAKPVRITESQGPQFKSYRWREPKLVTIRARDGAEVYARLYEAKGKKGQKPAVIFVHGAGYLQNAHRWWSQYFREYMFHNFLADNGYTVLDMDYRGSAGYGRDWRTGIYRHMGGKDLTDHVDGAKWLVETQGIDPKRIGIYGGSYGGFITLMGMFTTPGVFEAGAALRPVTDWAAYNHGYTSNILNEPQTDSLAYRRSSPIYYAEGLKGDLLICHGMVDVNVHFQDVVRLTQRLIELKKENWELAAYPVEDHGFVEPSSWADEYKRIFKLFERVLKR
ncbi:MAG TPA: prolyl oligopeptidase family serine peptidase [Saprospiraceae bacterium]|nr:prolyl oligopeptidase family serine peptidase [Saprospiraceae bacterium]